MHKPDSKIIFPFVLFVFSYPMLVAQQPKYTRKHFVTKFTPEFIVSIPKKDGLLRTYLVASPVIWDVDDDYTTYVQHAQKVLICMEGPKVHGKREGVFTAYLIDSLHHKKRYKLYEQTYSNDKLNGVWRYYCLSGNLKGFETYTNDSISGDAKTYWIDGETIMEEREYLDGKRKFVLKEYEEGKLSEEHQYINGISEGVAKRYYPSGILKEDAVFKNGMANGTRRYFYPSGKIWAEREEKDGRPWTVIGNYSEDGVRRDPGTLKDGDGTMILYKEDGTIRETIIYKLGLAAKQ
jgi:antitoxin component YwqK of YwqJK toxin-antitoxin module